MSKHEPIRARAVDPDDRAPIPSRVEQDRVALERAEAEGMVTEGAKVSAVDPPPHRSPIRQPVAGRQPGRWIPVPLRAWRWLTRRWR